MTTRVLFALSLLLLALALLLVGGALLQRARRLARSGHTVDHLIAMHKRAANPMLETSRKDWRHSLLSQAAQWAESPPGRLLVPEEDRRLLDVCGVHSPRGKALFMLARTTLSLLLPAIGLLLTGIGDGLVVLTTAFCGFALGFMLPKWVMKSRAAARRRAAGEELPLLVDMLRLLQGVGLSVDQSLHVIENEFQACLPVLCKELRIASRHYRAGRSREQSLRRLSLLFGNDELRTLTRFISQVERHGGAVQEPLKQFSERLREKRKTDLKERVGKLTVKMTMVMVLTLLPALLTITGGAAFLAVIRALTRIAGDA